MSPITPRIPGSSQPLPCINCSTTGKHSSDMLHVQQTIERTDFCPRCLEGAVEADKTEVLRLVADLARFLEQPAPVVLLDLALEARSTEAAR